MASDRFEEDGAANLNQRLSLMIGGPDRERVLLKTNFNIFLESAELALHRHPKPRFFAWLAAPFLTQKAYHQLNVKFFSSTDGTQCIHLGAMDQPGGVHNPAELNVDNERLHMISPSPELNLSSPPRRDTLPIHESEHPESRYASRLSCRVVRFLFF
jgi:hypothetical protein